jgi:hypothetical protein
MHPPWPGGLKEQLAPEPPPVLAELLSPRPTAKLQFGVVTEHLAEEVLVKERALLELVEQLPVEPEILVETPEELLLQLYALAMFGV